MSQETIAAVRSLANRPRRGFLAKALGGAGAAALTTLRPGRRAEAQTPATMITDPVILNFALNFEYLGSEYYTYATTGAGIEALGIPTTGTGTPGPVTIKSNPTVPFATAEVQQFAMQLALDEQNHVKYVRTVLGMLGVAPIARPAIDFLNSFNTLAMVAGLPTPFDPFANEVNFLLGAYIFEDVCVSALRGAAPLLKNAAVVAGAAGLLGVESYQAGAIRTLLFANMQGPATQAISTVRRNLGGGNDYGVATGPGGTSSVILSDSNALALARTPRQVLNIAYGAVNASRGLFFPAGVNGTVR